MLYFTIRLNLSVLDTEYFFSGAIPIVLSDCTAICVMRDNRPFVLIFLIFGSSPNKFSPQSKNSIRASAFLFKMVGVCVVDIFMPLLLQFTAPSVRERMPLSFAMFTHVARSLPQARSNLTNLPDVS